MGTFDNVNKTIYSKPSYIGLLELLEYIIFIIIIYKYNPFSISSKHPAFSNALTLFVALIYVLLFYFLREKISLGQDVDSPVSEFSFLIKVLSTLGFFIVSVFIIKYFAILITTGKTGLLTLFRYSILFLAVVSGLAILYTVFQPIVAKLGRSGKIGSFIVKFIMYTPCLLLALVDYFKNQYNITTRSVWLLLLAELILIVLWVIVPMVLSAYVSRNGVQLLKEPKYLNGENVVGTFDELYGKDVVNADVNSISQPKFNYHYSLSAWFYINPQPPNTSPAYNKYTNILNYGQKPSVEFNGQLNSLRISVDTQQEPGGNKKIVQLFETQKVLFQRWNNIVINYDRGTMDVFLNGELVGSRPSIAPYMTYESIEVGANNGIHGGVSNVMYYKDNLSRSYIEMMYQALRGKEEPFL